MGLEHWLEKTRMTQAEAAKVLGVTQARVSDLRRGKIDRFSMDLLVRLAARAGLKPKLKIVGVTRKSVDVHRRPVAANPFEGAREGAFLTNGRVKYFYKERLRQFGGQPSHQ
jgi:predicted XRE-type DNA-binding protein